MRVDIESVSHSIEVDEGCVMTTTTRISAATTSLSISAAHIHLWLGRRRYSLGGQTRLREPLPRVLPMSSRRAVRAREAVGPTSIARRLLLVALDFGRGAGVTGGPEPEMCSRCRHWSSWGLGVCLGTDTHSVNRNIGSRLQYKQQSHAVKGLRSIETLLCPPSKHERNAQSVCLYGLGS